MKNSVNSLLLGCVLLFIVTVPQVTSFMFETSSVGALFIALLCIALFVIRYTILGAPNLHGGKGALLAFTILLMILMGGIFSILIYPEFDFGRFSGSYILLVVFVLGAFSFSELIRFVPPHRFNAAVKFVFYALLLSSLAFFFSFSPFGTSRRPVFFYTEPSHYGLGIAPFLLYMVMEAHHKTRFRLIMLGCLLGLVVTNLTLIAGVVMMAAMVFSFRRMAVFIAVVAVLILTMGNDYLNHFITRMTLTSDTENYSALVYMSGWERALLDLVDTSGLGVGLQQFGVIGDQGEFMDRLAFLNADGLNLFDGGFVAAKFIGEFGLLAVALLALYLSWFLKYFIKFKMLSGNVNMLNNRDVFFISSFLMFFLDLFIRGGSYFSAEGFIFLASIFWLASGHLKLDGFSKAIVAV